jgi:hypothetical protein
MTTFTEHEVWEIINDLSAARAGNDDYNELAAKHTETIDSLSEEELADFTEKANLIAATADAFKQHVDAIANALLEELNIPSQMAKWTASDVHKYMGAVQTKGELADLLTLAPLAMGDPRILLAFVEPQEDDEEGAEATDGD